MIEQTVLRPEDKEKLQKAKDLLEGVSFLMRLSNLVGKPLETLTSAVPQKLQNALSRTVNLSLEKALSVAIKTLKEKDLMHEGETTSSPVKHKMAAAISGALGGFLGYPGLTIELPLSTVLIFRSIAQIAREQGEDISSLEARLECLSVFAFGGTSKADDGAETGYYAIRVALSQTMAESLKHLAEQGLAKSGSPVMMRLLTAIAARFGIQVSEKVMAQMIPVIGAVGGAAINSAFMNHFQKMATGHFMIRKLERTYGKELVQKAYQAL